MEQEILVRAYREDKEYINRMMQGKTERDRLHTLIQKFRQVTKT